MADGSLRPVEAVAVGEQVMGPDSKPRTVLATSRGIGPLFRVKQTSGIEYVVNDSHILSLKKSESSKSDTRPMASGNPRSPNGRYPGWADVTNIPVREAMAQSARWKSHFRGYRAGLIEFAHQPVAIDPYFLGAWLGDGTSRELRITTADEEIVSYCREVAGRVGGSITVHSKAETKAVDIGIHCQDGRENGIWRPFKAYGLPNNKHIPQGYIANSEAIRLELLAGLLDTDGHYRNHGYGIIQVNERLARDIKYLADTLGFRTNISKRKTICSNNGAKGFGWFVSINGDVWRIPCKIPRKQARREDIRKNKDFLLSQVQIEPCGEGEWAGFTLDGDHLFCLEDGTVTHNSWNFARALLILGAEKPLRILCAREFQTSIDDSVHRLLSDQIQALGLQGFYEIQKTQIIGANGTLIVFEGLRRNIGNLKSFEGCDICWVEEATDVSKASWEILIPTIRKEGSEIWISFNPELETDETFLRFVRNPPKESCVVKVNWGDNPWFPEVLRQEMEDLKARDHDSYLTVWEGHCRQSLDGAVYAKEIREATAANRITRVPYEAGKPVHTFWDLGKSDNTAIWFAQVVGFEFRIIDYYQNHGHNLSHYVKVLGERPYAYGTMWLPHDATHDLLASERTIEQQMRGFGFNVRITPKTSVATGIEAARTIFSKCWFDAEKCADGLQCLRHYRYDKKPDGLSYSKEPVHDWASHGGDSFRYLAVAMQEEKPQRKQSNQRGPQGSGAWLGA